MLFEASATAAAARSRAAARLAGIREAAGDVACTAATAANACFLAFSSEDGICCGDSQEGVVLEPVSVLELSAFITSSLTSVSSMFVFCAPLVAASLGSDAGLTGGCAHDWSGASTALAVANGLASGSVMGSAVGSTASSAAGSVTGSAARWATDLAAGLAADLTAGLASAFTDDFAGDFAGDFGGDFAGVFANDFAGGFGLDGGEGTFDLDWTGEARGNDCTGEVLDFTALEGCVLVLAARVPAYLRWGG